MANPSPQVRGHASKRRLALVGLIVAFAAAMAVALGAPACSSETDNFGEIGGYVDSGGDGTVDSGTSIALAAPDGSAALKPFAYPGDPGPGAFYVTISGESNALTGYPFPPADFTADTYMVDGWEFRIFEFLVVVDDVVLWSDPNLSATDQSKHGPQIAHLDGPFVVDLHKGGAIVGQGGAPELATPLGAIKNQNDNGNKPFDESGGTTYAIGFSTVAATWDAYNVNLDPTEAADFAQMVQEGYSVFYRGMAVWKGDDPGNPYAPCAQTVAGAGLDAGLVVEGDASVSTFADGGYDFSYIDKQTYAFALGFSTPTNYVNCQNMTMQGMALPGEDYPRGVAASESQSSIAQLTVHMDHPFWESFQEDTPVHWDDIAAQFVGSSVEPVTVTTEDFKGVRLHPWFDRTGTPLPWRNCVGTYYMPPGNGAMFFSTLSVPIDPQGTCTGSVGQDYTLDDCPVIRDYYDYIRYTQSTQGHLNSQGLCFIDRQYPAPAGGS